eukprot:5566062-Prymnesium_polylepis.1
MGDSDQGAGALETVRDSLLPSGFSDPKPLCNAICSLLWIGGAAVFLAWGTSSVWPIYIVSFLALVAVSIAYFCSFVSYISPTPQRGTQASLENGLGDAQMPSLLLSK